jgi:hypothetical protein
MKYSLLSIEADAKTSKGTEFGYLTGILYLAPAKEADGVHDLCPMATDECRKACLYGAGMAGVFPSIKRARVAKTMSYLSDPAAFMVTLAADIRKLVKEATARGLKPAVRLNGTSDLPKLAHAMAEQFPTVQFYDYTKLPKAWQRTRANYDLTFSFSGENMAEALLLSRMALTSPWSSPVVCLHPGTAARSSMATNPIFASSIKKASSLGSRPRATRARWPPVDSSRLARQPKSLPDDGLMRPKPRKGSEDSQNDQYVRQPLRYPAQPRVEQKDMQLLVLGPESA